MSTYGGILTDSLHRILVRKPRGDRHGWTFAQGRARPGEDEEDAVLRVVAETTGYRARLVAPVPGVFRAEEAEARYWVLNPLSHDRFRYEETEAVTWVSPGEARRLLGQTRRAADRARDLAALEAFLRRMG